MGMVGFLCNIFIKLTTLRLTDDNTIIYFTIGSQLHDLSYWAYPSRVVPPNMGA